MAQPIVMISSYPPRLCGIATFCEEARHFIQKHNPDREVLVISHLDGEGDGVIPIMDISKPNWWKPVADKVHELDPYAVHIEHEYGLYEHHDDRGRGDNNSGLIELLNALSDVPTVMEPHTIHGRYTEAEADFIYQMCNATDIVLFKCHYQKWRLDWNFSDSRGWKTPRNIMVVPHGAMPDMGNTLAEVVQLRKDLGLDSLPHLSTHLVGLIGWIQSNKRWDILTTMWEEIAGEIKERTGEDWDLLAAGAMRDPNHLADYEKYKEDVELLEKKGLAHYYEFIPRGEQYYKMMAVCDFIVLPSTDETQWHAGADHLAQQALHHDRADGRPDRPDAGKRRRATLHHQGYAAKAHRGTCVQREPAYEMRQQSQELPRRGRQLGCRGRAVQ